MISLFCSPLKLADSFSSLSINRRCDKYGDLGFFSSMSYGYTRFNSFSDFVSAAYSDLLVFEDFHTFAKPVSGANDYIYNCNFSSSFNYTESIDSSFAEVSLNLRWDYSVYSKNLKLTNDCDII